MDENSTGLNSLIDKVKTILEVLGDVFFVPIVNIYNFIYKFLRKNKLKLCLTPIETKDRARVTTTKIWINYNLQMTKPLNFRF